jgi:hypothetical protein
MRSVFGAKTWEGLHAKALAETPKEPRNRSKPCKHCGQMLPATGEYFYHHPKTADRLESACKTCRKRQKHTAQVYASDQDRRYRVLGRRTQPTEMVRQCFPTCYLPPKGMIALSLLGVRIHS